MDAIARYYDLDLNGFDDDLALYEGFAQRGDGSVLEVGCGTGRVAGALAQAGHTVTGLDISPAMLQQARARDDSVEWVEGDIALLDLGRTFDLIIAPLGTLHHLHPRERRQAFGAVAAHLRPGGRLVADLGIETQWEPAVQPLVCHWTRCSPATGRQVSKLVGVDADVATLTQEVTYLFDEVQEDGLLRRTTAVFDLSYFTKAELELLLELSSLDCEGFYGSYEFQPLTPASERMIVVAGKP